VAASKGSTEARQMPNRVANNFCTTAECNFTLRQSPSAVTEQKQFTKAVGREACHGGCKNMQRQGAPKNAVGSFRTERFHVARLSPSGLRGFRRACHTWDVELTVKGVPSVRCRHIACRTANAGGRSTHYPHHVPRSASAVGEARPGMHPVATSPPYAPFPRCTTPSPIRNSSGAPRAVVPD
jgi:hypothetical protein